MSDVDLRRNQSEQAKFLLKWSLAAAGLLLGAVIGVEATGVDTTSVSDGKMFYVYTGPSGSDLIRTETHGTPEFPGQYLVGQLAVFVETEPSFPLIERPAPRRIAAGRRVTLVVSGELSSGPIGANAASMLAAGLGAELGQVTDYFVEEGVLFDFERDALMASVTGDSVAPISAGGKIRLAFIVTAAVLAFVLAALLSALGFVSARTHLRRARGLCTNCGYPRSEQTCPECGLEPSQ